MTKNIPRKLENVRISEISNIDIESVTHLDFTGEELKNAVAEFGVLVPVILRENKSGGYTVIEGKKRILEAREAELFEIPAVVFPPDMEDEYEHFIYLIANLLRTTNFIDESYHVSKLADRGYTTKDISEMTGIIESQIKKRVKISKATDKVKNAVTEGLVNQKVLSSGADLFEDKEKKDEIDNILKKHGTIETKDISEIKKREKEKKIVEKVKEKLDSEVELAEEKISQKSEPGEKVKTEIQAETKKIIKLLVQEGFTKDELVEIIEDVLQEI